MSVTYASILWNKQKKKYDLGILIFVLSFTILFFVGHVVLHPVATFETIFIRNFGLIAFLFLHVVLVIGPLARINTKYLIILYNRRHLGVTMFIMAAIHGVFSILNFHSLSNMNPVKSVFLSNLRYDSIIEFPFQVLGFIALIILALMATTSHDFWLKNLGPKLWKSLHMLVYLAYALIILHVVLGALQNETSPVLFGVVLLGFILVSSMHIYAGLTERSVDEPIDAEESDFVKVCDVSEIEDNRAKIFTVSGERVAIFKYDGKLSAVNNFCRHQGGPLGEGKVVDGCITCPWHGYQYLPHNGQSPPPFTEKIETYKLKLEGAEVWIDPKPLAVGTEVTPIVLP
jgi:DMSO/TMAO reductase YedYZ heme-binding membrane subunit/nitrite reductase/ring-hydroxylating ferredoxin subunit